MSYKYDFELSSKRRTFLWLYQVLPNIDLIKEIYKLKENSELEDIKSYHGLCPRYIKSSCSWKPRYINDHFKIMNLREQMNANTLFMKLIMDDGFICEFEMNDSIYDRDQLKLIREGGWSFIIPDINYKPSLRRKIQCMNLMMDKLPSLSITNYVSIKRLYTIYINNDTNYHSLLGIDQKNRIYVPFQII